MDYKSDLRSVSNYYSPIRELFRQEEEIDLNTMQTPHFDYEGFNRDFFYLTSQEGIPGSYEKRRGIIQGLYDSLECRDRISPRPFRSCLDEIVRNAEEHGNEFNKDKKIGIGFREDKNKLDVLVEDEGGRLHNEFLPYILDIKDKMDQGMSFEGFYDYTQEQVPDGHSGSGLKTISYFYDDVTFHKSDLGGLLVCMSKYF